MARPGISSPHPTAHLAGAGEEFVMPAKGKHRRPKSLRFTRSIAVAGTGGAALALPLMGAAGAHAAPSQSVSEKAVQSLPIAGQKAADKKAAQKKTDVRTYSVKVGDYL